MQIEQFTEKAREAISAAVELARQHNQITRKQMKDIVDIQVNRLRPRLAERHITLHLTDSARDVLADLGYDPQFGARPLKRVIQREVENRIARAILEGTVRDGDTIEIDAQDGKLFMEAMGEGAQEEANTS
jgi:ATP-dependent Clp protease ATP-binding subunit ClpB